MPPPTDFKDTLLCQAILSLPPLRSGMRKHHRQEDPHPEHPGKEEELAPSVRFGYFADLEQVIPQDDIDKASDHVG